MAKKPSKTKPKQLPTALSNMPWPATPTHSAPAVPAPSYPQPSLSNAKTAPPPPNNFIDFETFINLANLDDIIRFCDAVASTQEGRNLKLLWDRAFEAGLDQGQTEEWRRGEDDRRQAYIRGKEMGIEEAEAAERSTELNFYLHGTEKGRIEERLEWSSAGHGPHCLTPIAVLSDEITQTDFVEPPIPATCDANIQACRPVANASAQTSTTVNYDSPMDPSSTDDLCSQAASASSETPLGTVWKHAFKAGQDDASRILDGLQVSDMLKLGFEKGQVHGIIQEREQWEMAGHSQTCFVTASSSTVTADVGTQVDFVTPLPPCTNASVQAVSANIQTSPSCADASSQTSTDFDPLNNAESIDLLCALSAVAPSETPLGLVWCRAFEAGSRLLQVNISDEPVIPPCVDASIQTTDPSPPIILPQKMSPPCLDWAEEAELFAIAQPPPPPHQPRDLSILRSSSLSPFSSLQRRVKRSTACPSRQLRHRHIPFNFDFPQPPPQACRDQPSFSRSHRKPLPNSSTLHRSLQQNPPCLNWESDPRLSNLSQALKALGWIHPQEGHCF